MPLFGSQYPHGNLRMGRAPADTYSLEVHT